jgi:hypothetical protein
MSLNDEAERERIGQEVVEKLSSEVESHCSGIDNNNYFHLLVSYVPQHRSSKRYLRDDANRAEPGRLY